MATGTLSGGRARPASSRRSGAAKSKPRRGAPQAAGIRWDRVGRVAMLLVLVALLYLYLSAGIHMLGKWSQARHHSAAVAALEREHVELVRQHEALSKQGTVEEEARQLGMIKPGEQPFIASGLPSN